jgi:hypothetical protein
MKTKLIVTLIASWLVAGAASATVVTGTFDSKSTAKAALIDFATSGDFSYSLLVDPTTTNKLKLGFSSNHGTFSNLAFTIFDAVNNTSYGSNFSVASGTYAFNDFTQGAISLTQGVKYKLTLTGHEDLVGSSASQFKIASTIGTVSAVPEPETYAMLLAGLGLVGTMIRRRKITIG